MRVSIAWAKHRRRFDVDNTAPLSKPVIDGMQEAGILINDSQITQITYRNYWTDARDTRMMIEIERDENPDDHPPALLTKLDRRLPGEGLLVWTTTSSTN